LALGSYNAFRGSGFLGEPREHSMFDQRYVLGALFDRPAVRRGLEFALQVRNPGAAC
jgi:hypothetical protein